MKKKRLFGILLFLVLLIMTACSGNVDAVPGDSQEYDYSTSQTLQEYDHSAPENFQENNHSASEDPYEYNHSTSENSDEYAHAASQTPYEPESEDQEQATELVDPGEDLAKDNLPEYGEYYYDLENVVLYLEIYDELPPNYITKNQAQDLGWEGGSVEKYKEGAAIGGDTFGNREGLLPKAAGRSYTECDIDTKGYSSRGSRRLVFSNDGLYFYTSDHYETFAEVTVTEEYEVVW